MKRFRVENTSIPFTDKFGERKFNELIITLYKSPYEDENILYKTGWNVKDCKITEMTLQLEEE